MGHMNDLYCGGGINGVVCRCHIYSLMGKPHRTDGSTLVAKLITYLSEVLRILTVERFTCNCSLISVNLVIVSPML